MSGRLPDSTFSKWLRSELVLPALAATSATGVPEVTAADLFRACAGESSHV